MRICFCFIKFFLIICILFLFSSCQKVYENTSDQSETVFINSPLTENPAASEDKNASGAEENSASEAEGSEISENDTEITANSQTSEEKTATNGEKSTVTEQTTQTNPETTAKKPETVLENSEITSEKSETTAVSKTETTALTLQYESPAETTNAAVKPSTSYGSNSYRTVNFKEQKGFWITYLEYGSILKNKSQSSFKASIGEYFDNISGLGFNTVYVQVRAFGDAYYNSKLFPSGEQFSGTIGTGSNFDALQVMIDCAHERGLSIHAWVNPMRLMTSSQLQGIDDKYQIKKWYNSDSYNGKYIVKSGDRWYLNPAYSEVTNLIADGISEIVSNYNVDGIQIDDYFYPTTSSEFDSSAYSASGTSLSLSKWRISNVNKMVKKLYSAAHSANSSISFGISPQGSVENDYTELYADVRTWCSESGYCDYILPQVYFGFNNAALPYADVISLWSSMVKNSNVKLVIGLAAYKIGAADSYAGASGKNEWLNNSDIISRQMKLARTLDNYGGVALYRYESIFAPTSDVAAQVSKEIANIEK